MTNSAAESAAAPRATHAEVPPGLLPVVAALLQTWRDTAAVRLGLFAHELRGAGLALAAMVGMAVAAACLVASSWLLLLALGLHLAIKSGLSWEAAGLLVLVLNGSAFAVLVAAVRRTGGSMLTKTLAGMCAERREKGHDAVA